MGDADGATDRGTDVGDDDVGTCFGHRSGFFRRADVNNREHFHLSSERDGFDFFLRAHPCLFEDLTELSIDDGMCREIIDTTKAHLFHLAQPMPHAATRIGRMYATNYWNFFDDGKDFVFTNLHRDSVSVAIGHHPSG